MRKLTLITAAVAVAIGSAGCGNSDPNTLIDKRDGQAYRTVIMPDGNRWMAENLNYKMDSSWCYENSADSCAKYGRLYSLDAAMKACPAGYRLPFRGEWGSLMITIGGEQLIDDDRNIVWYGAGKILRAKTGWKGNGNGTDNYGFSALPGGYRWGRDEFFSVGNNGHWWTATERDRMCYMSYENDYINCDNYFMDIGISVRCVKDLDLAVFARSIERCGKKNFVPETPNTLIDCRDGQKYRTVKIGEQMWMAQNLNYKTDSSWCYNDSLSYCKKYGRLYNWNAAKTACPAGYHLPSREEWNSLARTAGGVEKLNLAGCTDWYGADKKIKAKKGWDYGYRGIRDNGTDNFGFSAIPGGRRFTGGRFYNAGNSGFWWTAPRYGPGGAYGRSIYFNLDRIREDHYSKDDGFSIRCVADSP
jgi:uncharacterized protein (TIGR02145 family)